MSYFGLSILDWVALIVIGVLFIVQLFYYLFFYAAILFKKQATTGASSQVPVSVIICAKNEEENLKKILPTILNQNYPEFQVVVINDCSVDESENVLKEFQKQYPNLYYSSVKEDPVFKHGKKLAVNLGIKASKYDHLLFTDADCEPTSLNWIANMARHFSDKHKMVLGTYNLKVTKGVLNHMQRYENLHTKLLYLGFALRGRPYMGVGGNLAYAKELFTNNKGFAGHYHLPYGDDDLFVNSVATRENTTVEFSADTQVMTEGKETWRGYFKQKRRHMGAGVYYKKRHKRLLYINGLSMGMFFGFSVLALILWIQPIIIGALLLARIALASIIVNLGAKKLEQPKFYISFLWYDLFLPLMYFVFFVKNKLKPGGIRWK